VGDLRVYPAEAWTWIMILKTGVYEHELCTGESKKILMENLKKRYPNQLRMYDVEKEWETLKEEKEYLFSVSYDYMWFYLKKIPRGVGKTFYLRYIWDEGYVKVLWGPTLKDCVTGMDDYMKLGEYYGTDVYHSKLYQLKYE
jgi:hypothetical protein